MSKFFKRKLSVLEEMAGVKEPPSPPVTYNEPRHWPPPPPPLPVPNTYAPMPKVKPAKEEMEKVEMTACPKCGTFDCISLEEYQQRINITGAGVLSVSSKDVLQTCTNRQRINKMKEIEKDNPGIWGKAHSRNTKASGSTGPK